jgi:deoxyadenosine/deoxycytidine kinase
MSGRVIVIEGCPGAGKTLLSESLFNSSPNVKVLTEWVNEDMLAKYLRDMKKYASRFQFMIQSETVKRIKKAIQLAKQGYTVVVDRGIDGNRCFAEIQYEKGVISAADIAVYRRAYSYDLIPGIQDVQLDVIYLKAEVSTCMARIKRRNRDGEDTYDSTYITNLKSKHDDLLKDAKIVDANEDVKLEDGKIPREVLRLLMEVY